MQTATEAPRPADCPAQMGVYGRRAGPQTASSGRPHSAPQRGRAQPVQCGCTGPARRVGWRARAQTRCTMCALSFCCALARGLRSYSGQHLMNFWATLSHHCSSSPIAAYITAHFTLNGVWHWIHRALSRTPRPLRATTVSGALTIAHSTHKCTSENGDAVVTAFTRPVWACVVLPPLLGDLHSP